MLGTALGSAGNLIRLGIGKLMGDSMDTNEMEAVASAVEERLKTSVKEELTTQAEEIRRQEVTGLNELAETESREGLDESEIDEDIRTREYDALSHVREGIDQAANNIRGNLRGRAAEIEKTVLEQYLSEKLGQQIRLQVVGDEVKRAEGGFGANPYQSGTSFGSGSYSSGSQGFSGQSSFGGGQPSQGAPGGLGGGYQGYGQTPAGYGGSQHALGGYGGSQQSFGGYGGSQQSPGGYQGSPTPSGYDSYQQTPSSNSVGGSNADGGEDTDSFGDSFFGNEELPEPNSLIPENETPEVPAESIGDPEIDGPADSPSEPSENSPEASTSSEEAKKKGGGLFSMIFGRGREDR